MKQENLECHTLVIGSGPGGATTACILAEAGIDVLLVEEGGNYRQDSAPAYSLEEIDQKYRNGGLTPTFGKTKVTYIEGRCAGGGSEINAALCHFPLDRTIEEWRREYKIRDFSQEILDPYFRSIEKDFNVSRIPWGIDRASSKLKEGAQNLGWASEEVPRFWRYPEKTSCNNRGIRQSMTETMIPRAIAAGCRLLPDTWVSRLRIKGNQALSAQAFEKDESGNLRDIRIHYKRVVICGGPAQTATLLLRSGINGLVGKSFTLHPMVRAAVRFEDDVNDHTVGVPVQQVVEFKPEITLGCSHSALPHLAMWLGIGVEGRDKMLREWQKMTIFYVLVKGNARGVVKNFPGFNEAFVKYPLNERDLALLGEGFCKLGELLFSTGSVEIFSPVVGSPVIRKIEDMEPYRKGLPHGRMTVSTIHIFSTCPMGEARERCVVDSFGKMHNFENIWINDASILPDATGVNPQATVMAIARRNAHHMLHQDQ